MKPRMGISNKHISKWCWPPEVTVCDHWICAAKFLPVSTGWASCDLQSKNWLELAMQTSEKYKNPVPLPTLCSYWTPVQVLATECQPSSRERTLSEKKPILFRDWHPEEIWHIASEPYLGNLGAQSLWWWWWGVCGGWARWAEVDAKCLPQSLFSETWSLTKPRAHWFS